MSRKLAIPILVAASAATPALCAIVIQAINGSLFPSVIPLGLAVVAVAIWITYITGHRAACLTRRVDRLEAMLRVETLTLDTGSFRRPPLRRVD